MLLGMFDVWFLLRCFLIVINKFYHLYFWIRMIHFNLNTSFIFIFVSNSNFHNILVFIVIYMFITIMGLAEDLDLSYWWIINDCIDLELFALTKFELFSLIFENCCYFKWRVICFCLIKSRGNINTNWLYCFNFICL